MDIVALALELVGRALETPLERLSRGRNQIGVRDPGPVVALVDLALLVGANALQRLAVGLLVLARRDQRRHPPHRVRPAAVTGGGQQLGVGAHERHRHRHVATVRKHHLGPVREALDRGEDVVPAPGVEPGGVLAQLVQDLLHLERRRQRLDQHRRLDRPPRHVELILGEAEHVVPQPRLQVRLHLRQVEVRPRPAGQQPPGAVKEVQPEVKQRARHGIAADQHVTLGQMPAPRAHQQCRRIVLERVLATVGGPVADRAVDRVTQVDVPLDHVAPGRRVGVLEVGHEPVGARVQRVDDQLAVGRTGDLHPPLLHVLGDRRDLPVGLAHTPGAGEEVEHLARSQPRPPLCTR